MSNRHGAPWAAPDVAAEVLDDSWAVTGYGPVIASAIHRYKTLGRRGWARIFARLLLARLEQLGSRARTYDVIVASPTFVGHGGREFAHTELVLEWATRQGPQRWPFAFGVVERTRPGAALKECRGWRRRLALARSELRASLTVAAPEQVDGRAVLIYDDVMTTGVTSVEVARALRAAGATRTGSIVLARQALARSRPYAPAGAAAAADAR